MNGYQHMCPKHNVSARLLGLDKRQFSGVLMMLGNFGATTMSLRSWQGNHRQVMKVVWQRREQRYFLAVLVLSIRQYSIFLEYRYVVDYHVWRFFSVLIQ